MICAWRLRRHMWRSPRPSRHGTRRRWILILISAASALPFTNSAFAEGMPDGMPPAYSTPTPGKPAPTPWWRAFDDPLLTQRIEQALRENRDVEAARYRVREAEALARRNLAPLLPSVSVDVGANMSPFSSVGYQARALMGDQAGPSGATDMPDVFYTGSALLKVGLQADIWGRHYRNYRASELDAAATEDERDGQAAQLAGLVAEIYYDTVAARARLALLEEQLEINRTLLSLMEKRFERGQVTALDVLQQRQQVAATEALLPSARAVVETGLQQLAVLTGRLPTAPLPSTTDRLPELPSPPPTGAPGDLLRNLPELRAANARLRAAERRAESAFRGLLPSLRLSGDVGYQARYIDEFDGQETWGVGAVISVPLWEGGANHAALAQARAAQSAARHALAQSALRAVGDVESALARERLQKEHVNAIQRQLEAAQLASEEAQQRYMAGLDSYLNVLTALNIHQQTQLTAVQSQRDLIIGRLRVCQALGGAWTRGLAAKTRRGARHEREIGQNPVRRTTRSTP